MDTSNVVTVWLAAAGPQIIRRAPLGYRQSHGAARQQDGHEATPHQCTFGAEPNLLFALAQDGTVRTWELDVVAAPSTWEEVMADLQRWQTEACLRAGRLSILMKRSNISRNGLLGFSLVVLPIRRLAGREMCWISQQRR